MGIEALGVLQGQVGPGAGSALPELINRLEDPDTRVRVLACRAIGRLAPDSARAVQALAGALADKVWRVRWSAAHALAGMDPAAARAAKGALGKALKDERREVRDAAGRALKRLGG